MLSVKQSLSDHRQTLQTLSWLYQPKHFLYVYYVYINLFVWINEFVVYSHTNTSGNIIKHNLRTSMNERTYFFIKIYLSHFILERVDVSVVCLRDGWRDIYSERGLLLISSSRSQGVPTLATPCKLVRDASDRLRVSRSTAILCTLSKSDRVVLITWSPSGYTPVWSELTALTLSSSCLLIKMWQLATRNEPKIPVICKGLVWYGCWVSLEIPPAAFLPEVDPAGILKGRDDLADGASPGLTVSSKCRQLVVVNVTDTGGLLEGVFKTFLWCPSVIVASEEFTIQGYLGHAMPTPYSGDMPCPS